MSSSTDELLLESLEDYVNKFTDRLKYAKKYFTSTKEEFIAKEIFFWSDIVNQFHETDGKPFILKSEKAQAQFKELQEARGQQTIRDEFQSRIRFLKNKLMYLNRILLENLEAELQKIQPGAIIANTELYEKPPTLEEDATNLFTSSVDDPLCFFDYMLHNEGLEELVHFLKPSIRDCYNNNINPDKADRVSLRKRIDMESKAIISSPFSIKEYLHARFKRELVLSKGLIERKISLLESDQQIARFLRLMLNKLNHLNRIAVNNPVFLDYNIDTVVFKNLFEEYIRKYASYLPPKQLESLIVDNRMVNNELLPNSVQNLLSGSRSYHLKDLMPHANYETLKRFLIEKVKACNYDLTSNHTKTLKWFLPLISVALAEKNYYFTNYISLQNLNSNRSNKTTFSHKEIATICNTTFKPKKLATEIYSTQNIRTKVRYEDLPSLIPKLL